jgi:hypothetical protein
MKEIDKKKIINNNNNKNNNINKNKLLHQDNKNEIPKIIEDEF